MKFCIKNINLDLCLIGVGSLLILVSMLLNLEWLSLIFLYLQVFYYSFKRNSSSLFYCFELIILQSLFLILFADQISIKENTLFSIAKEVLMYFSVFLSFFLLFIKKKYKIEKLDILFFVFLIYLGIQFVITGFSIQSLMAIRQVLIGMVGFYFGKCVILKRNELLFFEKILIYTALLASIFGLLEYFFLGDFFWNTIPFKSFIQNKGVSSWLGETGVTQNFYTYDFVFIIGDKIRRLVSFFADPMVAGHIILFGAVIAIKRKSNPFLIALLIISALLSFSKGVYLVLILLLVLFFSKHLYEKNKTVFYFFTCSILCLGIAVIFYLFSFSGNSSSYKHILGLVTSLSNISIFGHGLGLSGSFVTTVMGTSNAALTTESYIGSIISQLGLVGIILYLSFFLYLLKQLLIKYQQSKFCIDYFLCACLLLSLTIESFFSESAISSLGTGIYFIYFGLIYSKDYLSFKTTNISELNERKFDNSIRHIFIIGSKGIPAKYGGFETFVDELISRNRSKKIQYHVSCLSDNYEEYTYNNAHCFNIKVPNIGPAKAIYYDLFSIKYCIQYMKENNLSNCIVYVLACRIGPFIRGNVNKIHRFDSLFYVNPDGHEWKRAKWNYFIKKYWKLSERLMVKYADLLICDSKNIEKYIQTEYNTYSPKTVFIPYGADTSKSSLKDDDSSIVEWNMYNGVRKNNYYLVVGRFVPENNYETMIKEYMKTKTNKDFVLITNVENNRFYNKLKKETNFTSDHRIKFVGTVYNSQLLKKIRENAYGYIHGHEVGGTNPSLLEALATTKINLLLNVGFNKEVANDGAVYWTKDEGNLAALIDSLDTIDLNTITTMSKRAKQRIDSEYNWDLIVKKYENLFLER